MGKNKKVLKCKSIATEKGEKTSVTETYYGIPVNTESFIMLFFGHSELLYNIESVTDFKVLGCMLSRCQWNDNKVYLSGNEKKKICEFLTIKYQTLLNSLQKLKKHKIITGNRDEFYLNEKMFWKGSLSERLKKLKENNLL